MGVELIEYIEHFFLLISMCIFIASSVAFVSSRKKTKDEDLKIKKWEKKITDVLSDADLNLDTMQKHWQEMKDQLTSTDELLAYGEALVSIRNRFDGDFVQKYIDMSADVFNHLAYFYKQRGSPEKGAFSFIMANLHPGASLGNTELPEVLLTYFDDADSDCIENILLALCTIGYPQSIARAFEIVTENKWTCSTQLLSDALTWTVGNRKDLATYLALRLMRWNESIQVTIIKFVTNVSGEFADGFLEALQDSRIPTETRFALIRYFGRWIYNPAKPLLIRITKEDDPVGYAVASAQVLKKYSGEDTKEALISALRSSNWDVRRNAAMSLIELGADMKDVIEMNKNGDAYAAQMLGYYLQERNVGRVSRSGEVRRMDARGEM